MAPRHSLLSKPADLTFDCVTDQAEEDLLLKMLLVFYLNQFAVQHTK